MLFAVRLAQFFGEQAAHVGGRHVDGGRDDMDRALPGQLDDVLAQVGLDGPDAGRFEHAVQFHLLADHRLRLDDALDVVLFGDIEHVLIGLGRVLGPEHGGAPGGDLLLELDQQLVEIGDGETLDLMGRLAPVLKIRDGIGHFLIVFARPLGRRAQRFRRMRFGKTLGQRGEELGAVEVVGFGGHWRGIGD